MADQHRNIYHQLRKGDEEQQQDLKESHHAPPRIYPHVNYLGSKNSKWSLLCLFFLFSLISCILLYAPSFLFISSSPLPFSYSKNLDIYSNSNNVYMRREEENKKGNPCSSITNNSICCDRTSYHTDICFMRGDVRTLSSSSSILLHSSPDNSNTTPLVEKIKPYTRKWEPIIMDKTPELHLKIAGPHVPTHRCDVHHDAPALVFSAGGYTGNVFHAFSNGILPLYITSQHLNRRVVLVVLQYRNWWYTKYHEILSALSDYPPIDFFNDTRTHCFPEAIIGLRFHGTLAIDPARMINNKTIGDFHYLLDEAYKPRIRSIIQEEMTEQPEQDLMEEENMKPKLVIVSRNGSRAIENEGELVQLGKEIGFNVEILRPNRTMELARINRVLNGCDVMIGVHGAALTHFLFMRPGSVLIQIVPLGIDRLAQACFAEPATKMGLRYEGYEILPYESSLYREYGKDDPVLQDPESVRAKGWEVTKEVYLDGQNVRLDLNRFRKRLVRIYGYLVPRRS